MAGEASSSRQKRQRLKRQRLKRQRLVEEEEEENGGGDVVAGSGTLFDLNLLDCPVCSNALTSSIFQCDNGHIACSSCCTKLRHICPSCTLPIGIYRCRIMEEVVKAIIVPCPNTKHGCTETFSYGKELVHEKKCVFSMCYCPAPNCNYRGLYKDLYIHFYRTHYSHMEDKFNCGRPNEAWLRINEKMVVLQELKISDDGPLVVVQCFNEPGGWYVTVNCIAPSAPGVGEYSFDLKYQAPAGGEKQIMRFYSSEMNRIQKVSFQTPEKDFMLIPHYFQDRRNSIKMTIWIHRLQKKT
ncbi:hypothetical protein CARUB_v10021568mg [Capsella rubella]|uniref:RING-type E3 ubiquitin transferase n=1 Tax=Capsella rubella TaxID=81985 RepID=R0HW69_9BRAS|nr:hypothetical protein CARUB_v10021568mg [Capsella rubella]